MDVVVSRRAPEGSEGMYAAPLAWRTGPLPSQGWYWFFNAQDAAAELMFFDGQRVKHLNGSWSLEGIMNYSVYSQWYGPISAPDMPKE